MEVTEGPSVIMEGAVGAGEEGLSDDEEQFVVQDSAPLELPDTDAFQPTTQQDKPEGEYVHLLNYTTRRLLSGLSIHHQFQYAVTLCSRMFCENIVLCFYTYTHCT